MASTQNTPVPAMISPTLRPFFDRSSFLFMPLAHVRSVHVAFVDALGKLGLAAGGQNLGLRDPVVAADAPLEALQVGIDPCDLIGAPARDLVEMIKTKLMQEFFQLGSDPLDFLEVVGLSAARPFKRLGAGALTCCRVCGALVGIRSGRGGRFGLRRTAIIRPFALGGRDLLLTLQQRA